MLSGVYSSVFRFGTLIVTVCPCQSCGGFICFFLLRRLSGVGLNPAAILPMPDFSSPRSISAAEVCITWVGCWKGNRQSSSPQPKGKGKLQLKNDLDGRCLLSTVFRWLAAQLLYYHVLLFSLTNVFLWACKRFLEKYFLNQVAPVCISRCFPWRGVLKRHKAFQWALGMAWAS